MENKVDIEQYAETNICKTDENNASQEKNLRIIKIKKKPQTDLFESKIIQEKKSQQLKKIIRISIILVFISIIVIVIFIEVNKHKKRNRKENSNNNNSSDETILHVSESENLKRPIEKEFEIITKKGDFKQILVTQKTKEEEKIDDNIITNNIIRKTNYDIYFLAEEEVDKNNKLYYEKIFTGIISIKSECISEEDDCDPQPLVDLAKDSYHLRNLENTEIFKDQPIALCLFNITDNNVITTLTCPESLPDSKRNEMILDLYFFRPPATQRADKKNDNITLTITKEKETNNIHIREINGGSCNVYANWGTQCTTDMNTTLDKNNNLLTYDEQAITIINYDKKNSYIKDKRTHLEDISKNIQEKDIDNYKNSLDNLLPLLKPYLKEEIQFTVNDYKDLYNVINDKKKPNKEQSYSPKKIKNTFRNLAKSKIQQIKNENLFVNRVTPIQVNLDLKINSGLNSEIMGAYGSIIFDNQEIDYSSIEEISELKELIDKLTILSKAGNILAKELYDKIYDKLEAVINEISVKFNSIDEYFKYYNILQIFNSTLTKYSHNILSSNEVQISNELLSKLSGIFTNIKSGEIKNNRDILKNNIESFFNEMYEIKNNMIIYLSNLSNLLSTINNKYILIKNYYLNETSDSYYNIVKKIKNIIDNYVKNECDAVSKKLEEVMEIFEQNSKDTLINDLSSFQKLISDLKEYNFTVDSLTNNEYQLIMSNLENSLQYPFDIINKIKNYILEIININNNEKLITNEDVNNLNKSFSSIDLEVEKAYKKLNDIDIIDTDFDEIMIKFRESYIDTVKFMEEIKVSNFTLEDDILNDTLFTPNVKNKMENELKKLSDNIINKIKEENNIYMEKIKRYLDKIYEDNHDELNDIIIELSILFSDDSLQEIEKSFEISLNLCLDKLSNLINNNINLTEQYINQYYNILNDENYLKEYIENYYLNNNQVNQTNYDPSSINKFPTFDLIYGNKITSAYFQKYNTLIANLNYSEEYLANQFQFDIINEYREIFIKIKEELKLIINNKLTDKFQDTEQINFFENHAKIINKLSSRLDKYFSDEMFDNKYLPIVEKNINNNINLIKSSKNNINNKNNFIKTFPSEQDNINDMCILFRRKVCYGCTNCVAYTFFFDTYCFILSPYEYNYLKIEKVFYEQVKNFGNFNNIFNKLNDLITTKINKYNDKFINLDYNISLLMNETLKENITFNYLSPINDWIDLNIEKKFGNVILNYSYEYYKLNIEKKLEVMFNDIFIKWQNAFNNLGDNIQKFAYDLKYSNFEFTNMAENYLTIIQSDHLENYFNSINLFEKYELNYTISFYYNYFINILNKSFKYITQNIPKSENNYNDILKIREKELKKNFDNFNLNIADSERECLSKNNQLKYLNVNETDFFKVKYILNKTKNETKIKLNDVIEDIFTYEFFTNPGDEYSLMMRFYLENKVFRNTIEQYYEPYNNGKFLNLNLNKFRNVMIENWVFDSYDFTNLLINALYETNKEIANELFAKKEQYSTLIENEITKFFDDNLEKSINDLFINNFKDFSASIDNNITFILLEFINSFKANINFEAQRIDYNPRIYTFNIENIKADYDKLINNINENINIAVFSYLNDFYEKIYNIIYVNCIETNLELFLTQTENIITSSNSYGEFILLNSSFKTGEIIYNLTTEVINNYKNIINKIFDLKYSEYYEKIKSSVNLSNLYSIVNNTLNEIYHNELLPVLNQKNNCSLNNCSIYNLTYFKGNDINDLITKLVKNIKYVMANNKNDDYDINFQCNLDFSNSGKNIIKRILKSLKSFLSFEKEEQISRINEFIQNEIKLNLEDFLNNVIPTFGNIFFERIIDYNINFKIVDLNRNIHYALGQTILYYKSLEVMNNFTGLPIDLKNKLYELNNLELIIIDKSKKIKEVLNVELINLIDNLKDIVKEIYTHFLKEDEMIKIKFSYDILEKINLNLDEIMPDIEKSYRIILEKYLKEKFIKEFYDSLDNKSSELIELFFKEKLKLKESLDNLFSSKKDEEFDLINKYIYKSLDSAEEYKTHLSNFEISENPKKFFIDYANNIFLPIFQQFSTDFAGKMKYSIITEINKNSEEIENLSFQQFELQVNDIYNNFILGYFNNINKDIYQYCNEEEGYNNSYFKNLMEKKEQNKEYYSRRRLVESSNEDDIANEAKKRIESKDVEETLDQLLNKTNNVLKYIDNINTFLTYERKIKDFQNNLNIDYKNIKEMIIKNQYIHEIDLYLKQKLINITHILSSYYKNINSSIYILKNDLLESIKNIHNSISFCTDITSYILNNEYQKISDTTERINKSRQNYNEVYPNIINYKHQSENMMIEAKAYIKKLNEYAEFQIDLYLEGNKFKIPKINAKILNRIIPKEVSVIIGTGNSFCHEKYYRFSIEPNDANYTMSLEYDTKSNYINITTFSSIENYQYKFQVGERIGNLYSKSMGFDIIDQYIRLPTCTNITTKLSSETIFDVPSKKVKESIIIFNN